MSSAIRSEGKQPRGQDMEKGKGDPGAAIPTRVLRAEEALAAAVLEAKRLKGALGADDGRAEGAEGAGEDRSHLAGGAALSSARMLHPLGQEYGDRIAAQAFGLLLAERDGENENEQGLRGVASEIDPLGPRS